jgi:hypothetical protein
MPPRLFSTAYANARSSPNPNLSSTATNTSPSSAPTLAVRRRHRTLLFRRRRRVLLLVPACRRAPSPALHYSTMLAASPPSLRRGRSDPCSTPASLASNAVAPGKCGGGGDASDGGSVAPMVELKAGSGLSSDRIGSWRSGERAMLREREYFRVVRPTSFWFFFLLCGEENTMTPTTPRHHRESWNRIDEQVFRVVGAGRVPASHDIQSKPTSRPHFNSLSYPRRQRATVTLSLYCFVQLFLSASVV